MIVVLIVGVLAAIAVPAFQSARRRSRVSAYANDLRLAVDAFQLYAMDHGDYPADSWPGVIPAGMDEYLPRMDWTEQTPLGGHWDWERNAVGISAGVSAFGSGVSMDDFLEVDKRIDDGDLTSGRFRRIAARRYTYVIEN